MCFSYPNQPARLFINVLFLSQYKLRNRTLHSLAKSSLKNTCLQKSLCANTTVREFADTLVLAISCEPVENESRNFSAQNVYKLFMSDGNETCIHSKTLA